MVVGAVRRFLLVNPTDIDLAAAYAIFAAAVLFVSAFGFKLMLLVNKIAVIAATALFFVGAVAFYPAFDVNLAGSGMQWGESRFWPAFIGAALVALANPISFGAFLGDWSRYLPRSTDKWRLMGASVAAQLLSLLPFAFGLEVQPRSSRGWHRNTWRRSTTPGA